MLRIIEFFLKLAFAPMLNTLVEIDVVTPICHDKLAEFTGNFTSLFGELFFFRCGVCGQEFTRQNTHNGLNIWQFWRLVFFPAPKPSKK